jgi:AmmeMemoRadiSam system protein B
MDASASAMSGEPVRRAAQAGRFYTDDPRRLARQVDALLEAIAGRASTGDAAVPLGLLVPHAGLDYSGAVAAAAWAALAVRPPDTIVIAGTNHGDPYLHGVGLWPAGSWEIPLGRVAVDAGLAGRILELGAPFSVAADAHRGEHSIEVQLPFIARALPATRIVPFLVASAPARSCLAAGERLGELLRGELAAGARVALVASSDLAHYPDEANARAVDARMIEAILALDGEELARREAAVLDEGIPGLACGLCGIHPTVFTLAALRAMGATRAELLASATSADAGGGRWRCVGYAAVAFTR